MTSPPTADSSASGPRTPVAHRTGTSRRWTQAAAIVCALQGLALVGFVGFYIYEIALGAADDLGRAVMSCVLMAAFALGLLALARGWRRDLDWPRTPTIVWNALLLPVAWSMYQADRPLVAVTVGGTALLAFVAALAAGSLPEHPAEN